MIAWLWFWTACLVVAGGAFAAITVVVIVKGGPDLRETLARLRQQKRVDEHEFDPRDPLVRSEDGE
ncbi:MAG TPA: hypothetical protein VL309_11540 [Vicinamibacterales bacterium]|nr:hypothetical protein [Vicinamibacterales bacterium]